MVGIAILWLVRWVLGRAIADVAEATQHGRFDTGLEITTLEDNLVVPFLLLLPLFIAV